MNTVWSSWNHNVEAFANNILNALENCISPQRPQGWKEECRTTAKVAMLWTFTSVLLQATAFNPWLPMSLRCAGGLLSVIATGSPLCNNLVKHIHHFNQLTTVEKVVAIAFAILLGTLVAAGIYMSTLYVYPSVYLWSIGLQLGCSLTVNGTLLSYSINAEIKERKEREDEFKQEFKAIEASVKVLKEGLGKLIDFIKSHPKLNALYQSHLADHRDYIVNPGPAYEMKEPFDKFEQMTRIQIERIHLECILKEIKVYITSYSDLFNSFREELEKSNCNDFQDFGGKLVHKN